MLFKNKIVDPIDDPMDTIENESVDGNRIFYIRIEFDRHHKGLHRNSFADSKYTGAVLCAKLKIIRQDRGEFNLKTDLKLG